VLVSAPVEVVGSADVVPSEPSVAVSSPPTPDESNAHDSVPRSTTHRSDRRDIEYDPWHSPVADDLDIDGRVLIPAAELVWTAVRAQGPGGQNVNKLATKIDLRFDLVATNALAGAVKTRLRALAKLDADGRVVITAQEARTQLGNLERAKAKLAELIRRALDPPKPRRKTKPSRSAKRRRLEGKRAVSEKKATRGRVSSD